MDDSNLVPELLGQGALPIFQFHCYLEKNGICVLASGSGKESMEGLNKTVMIRLVLEQAQIPSMQLAMKRPQVPRTGFG